jgi:GntR family transcriptional regulator, transcriptional repressor for pyruvate dehydrogenase complex
MIQQIDLLKVVKSEIKQYIIDNRMKSGDLLPTEKMFSEILGVSRTIIREAFSGLESLNLIETHRGRGRFVREISYGTILNNLSFILELEPDEFKSVLEIRIALEHYYLPAMIDNLSEQDIGKLENICAELKKEMLEKNNSDEGEDNAIEIHSEFHRMLYINCGNKLLIDIIKVFANMQKFFSKLSDFKTHDRVEFIKKHEKLIDAIKKKDRDEVKQLLDRHYEEVSHNLDLLK